MVYQLCDGKNSIADISKLVSKKINQPLSDDLVWLALDSFKKDNLLENNEHFEINFNGLSRRQVIKKVGLASLIMLPLVTSVIAPQAAQAQSCVGLGQPCSSSLSVDNCCAGQGVCLLGTCISCTNPGAFVHIGNSINCEFWYGSNDCRNVTECETCRDYGGNFCCSGQINIGGACA